MHDEHGLPENIEACAANAPFGIPELADGLAKFREAQSAADQVQETVDEAQETADEAQTAPPQGARKPLCGGIYTPSEALELLNSHFFIGKNNQETAVFRVNSDGSTTFMQPEQFKLEIQHIFVEWIDRPNKPIPAEKFWKENPQRREREIVFKPRGTTDPREFNLWRGFGVEPREGWQKQRRLLRHIREVICRRDTVKFNYFMRYLAWAVQNPDKHAGVILTLKSRKQGTGKSTIGVVLLTIFGRHGALIDDKDRLLGRFTDWLENVCFVLAEEILFASDYKTNDKLKSIITADTIQIERKFGSLRQIPNRLKTIATTNHDHATGAGVGDRRNVVYDVSDERGGDKEWFDSLYEDLDAGGTSEFLDLLLRIKLGDWHPRQIIHTQETAEQQRMSGDSVCQWSQACIGGRRYRSTPRAPRDRWHTRSWRADCSANAPGSLQRLLQRQWTPPAKSGGFRQSMCRHVRSSEASKGATEQYDRQGQTSSMGLSRAHGQKVAGGAECSPWHLEMSRDASFSAHQRRSCQSASDRDPVSASKRDPLVLRFERLALVPSELAGIAETARARVVV